MTLCGAGAAVLLLCRRKTESEIGITQKKDLLPFESIPGGRPDAEFKDFLNILEKNGIAYDIRQSKPKPNQTPSLYADFDVYKKYKLTVRNSDHINGNEPIHRQRGGYLIDLSILKKRQKGMTGKYVVNFINKSLGVNLTNQQK